MTSLLTTSKDTLQHILSFLTLDDVSMIVTLCKYTSTSKKQLYELVRHVFIDNKIYINKIVENCPKIKHVTIEDYDLTNTHFNMLQNLELESLVYTAEHDRSIRLAFKNLKRIELHSLSYTDILGCVSLEHITIEQYDRVIHKYNFPNLKSLRITHGIYSKLGNDLPYDLPITEIAIGTRLDDRIFSFPLDRLHLDIVKESSEFVSLVEHSNIKHLNIHGNVRSLNDIPYDRFKLISLTLAHGILTTQLNIPTLRKLELLSMDVNLDALKPLVNLTDLSLHTHSYSYNKFDVLSTLPITKLSLDSCRVNLDVIAKMKLTHLELYDCTFNRNGIDMLPETLVSLELANSIVCIHDIPYFSKMHTLKIHNMSSNKQITITNTGLMSISRLPITTLKLYGCGLTDDHIDYIADMNVNYLDIQNNDITIFGVRKLRKLPLRRLEVSGIPILHFMS